MKSKAKIKSRIQFYSRPSIVAVASSKYSNSSIAAANSFDGFDFWFLFGALFYYCITTSSTVYVQRSSRSLRVVLKD